LAQVESELGVEPISQPPGQVGEGVVEQALGLVQVFDDLPGADQVEALGELFGGGLVGGAQEAALAQAALGGGGDRGGGEVDAPGVDAALDGGLDEEALGAAQLEGAQLVVGRGPDPLEHPRHVLQLQPRPGPAAGVVGLVVEVVARLVVALGDLAAQGAAGAAGPVGGRGAGEPQGAAAGAAARLGLGDRGELGGEGERFVGLH
jgi:hypothetical protein